GDPTSTSRLRVTVTPRRPGFDFEGLEHEVPRAWHPDGIGPTAFLEALSAMAPVVEGFFIDDARRLLPRVADGATRAEGDAFLRQEAAHANMHAGFNRLLVRWGVDRKSTRLNSSHLGISYAVFCLKKKKKQTDENLRV